MPSSLSCFPVPPLLLSWNQYMNFFLVNQSPEMAVCVCREDHLSKNGSNLSRNERTCQLGCLAAEKDPTQMAGPFRSPPARHEQASSSPTFSVLRPLLLLELHFPPLEDKGCERSRFWKKLTNNSLRVTHRTMLATMATTMHVLVCFKKGPKKWGYFFVNVAFLTESVYE